MQEDSATSAPSLLGQKPQRREGPSWPRVSPSAWGLPLGLQEVRTQALGQEGPCPAPSWGRRLWSLQVGDSRAGRRRLPPLGWPARPWGRLRRGGPCCGSASTPSSLGSLPTSLTPVLPGLLCLPAWDSGDGQALKNVHSSEAVPRGSSGPLPVPSPQSDHGALPSPGPCIGQVKPRLRPQPQEQDWDGEGQGWQGGPGPTSSASRCHPPPGQVPALPSAPGGRGER